MRHVHTALRFLKRVIRTGKTLAGDTCIPKWLRWLFVFGCLPIPVLPIDEAALVLAVALMAVFYRARLREAWSA